MPKTFDVNNFVIDRVIRGLMTSTSDGSVLWSLNQITNPSLSISSETAEAVDALGNTIAQFYRSKTAEFSAENSLFDLALLAAQSGSEKNVASAANKIKVPIFETVTTTSASTVTLKHAPVGQITKIYALKGDSTLGTSYTNGSAASATEFVHVSEATQITLPTGLSAGTQLMVIYDYESEAAVEVVNNATDFPKAGRFVLEVLGCDVCDQTNLIHAYVVFPVAKLSPDTEISFATDGTHNLTITAFQDYCDREKRLFSIIVPEEN